MTQEEKKQELEKIFGYDTEEGITKLIEQGLDGFHRLVHARSAAYYKRKERLQEFIVLGRWWFDTCGNLFQLDEGGMPPVAPVIEKLKLMGVFPGITLRGTMSGPLPKPDTLCELCGHGWKLENVQDAESTDIGRDGEFRFEFRHKLCCRIHRAVAARAEFAQVFDNAGFQGKYTLNAVPNEYCPCVVCAPWFVAETPYGQIKIGWRKRVLNIDWSGTENAFPTLFAEEDVTQGPTYIHAWGYEKATDYLGRILRELKRRKDEDGTPVPA